MTRLAALALLCVAAGCSDGDAPPDLTEDLGVSVPDQGLEDAGDGGDGGMPDLVSEADLSDALPPAPRACVTACDCDPGERCLAHVCTREVVAVYCCGAASCVNGNVCESSRGQVSQCGEPPDAGLFPDAGAASCSSLTCIDLPVAGNVFCRTACGSPSAQCKTPQGGGTAHCMP